MHSRREPSPELFERIVRGLPMALVSVDHELRILHANDAATKLLASAPTPPLAGRGLFESTSLSGALLPALRAVMATGEAFSFWGYPVTREGAPESFVDLHLQRLGDGELLLTAIDVSDRVTAERGMQDAVTSARRSTEKLRATVEQMADGVLISDEASPARALNDAARHLLGDAALSSIESAAGLPTEVIRVANGDAPLRPEDAPWRRAMEHGETVIDADLVVRRNDDDLVMLSVSAAPLHDERGRRSGAVSVLRDMTAVQRALVELRIANAKLQENDRLKSEFVANMSHELRTPLNAILGFAQLLMMGPGGKQLTEKQGDALGRIIRNGKALLSLIDGVLDVAKIEAGVRTFHPEHFDVVETVEAAFGELESLAQQKRLDYRLRVEGEFPLVFTDRAHLRQIVVNLLSNALKFTMRGKVELTMRRDDENLCIAVSDSGTGIKPENLSNIFEKFRQVDGSMTRQVGGIGLGLSIVRELTELLGGTIDVESTFGQGTTFTLRLPLRELADEEEDEEDDREQVEVAAAEPPASQRPLILVIEDNTDSSVLLRRSLESAGFEVRVADTGVAGLRLARRLRPAAITLDIMMPKMDGWRVLQALREDTATAAIPVVVCSIVDNRPLGYKLGASEYLTKPVSPTELLTTLAKVGASPMAGERDDVIVVDDERALRDLVAAVLEDAGMQVRQVRSGEEAIAEVKKKAPKAIFVDVDLPGGMSGFELLARLRSDPEIPEFPAIVLTGKDMTADVRARLHDSIAEVVRTGNLELPDLVRRLQALLPTLGIART